MSKGYRQDLPRPSEETRQMMARRQALGLTQSQLARLARVSLSTITSLERGKNHAMRPATREKIQAALAREERLQAMRASRTRRWST